MNTKAKEQCQNVERCPMFPLFSQRAILNIYKNQYCYGEFNRCERLKTMRSGTKPADNLLPDGSHLPAPLP